MKKSIYSKKQSVLLEALIEARGKAGLTQQQVADKIGKPQSFVAKYEGGERRLDVVELIEVTEILNVEAVSIVQLAHIIHDTIGFDRCERWRPG